MYIAYRPNPAMSTIAGHAAMSLFSVCETLTIFSLNFYTLEGFLLKLLKLNQYILEKLGIRTPMTLAYRI